MATTDLQHVAARLAARPPLPTVDDIAGPILRALLALQGEQTRIDGFAFLVHEGEFVDEAAAVVALVEEIATAIELVVDGPTTRVRRRLRRCSAQT